MSEANQVALRAVRESTYGTTPVDDNGWEEIRYVSESITGTPRVAVSNEIRADRNRGPQFKVGTDVGGDINVELSDSTYDSFFEAAFHNAWATNTLTIGTTDFSYTIEKEFQDLTTTFHVFTGMRVAGFNFSFQFGEGVTGGFSFAGNGVDVDNVVY